MDDPVVVATYDFVTDAHIACGKLAADGIDAWLRDEHIGQTDWPHGLAIGGIKLQVAAGDAARALAVLARDDSHLLD